MRTDYFGPFGDQGPRAMHGHGHRGGPFGSRSQAGGPRVLPYLAAAFVARAMFERARRGYGQGDGDAGHRGWGPDAHGHGPDDGQRFGDGFSHGRGRGRGPGWGRGQEGNGMPWGPWARGRGGWGGDAQDYQQARDAFRTLRPEVSAIVSALRAALVSGKLDARRLSEVRVVLAETRARVTAILAENGPTTV